MKSCTMPTNSASSTMYSAAAPTNTTMRYKAAWTMLRAVTTRTAAPAMATARIQNATFCAVTAVSPARRSFLAFGLGADLERLRLGHGLHPLAELVLVVEQLGDVDLGVLVLRAPEQRVERADLYADPAVHAQRVVDVEPVEKADRALPAAFAAGRTLLLVALDVDAPVGALARTQHADGA